MNNMRKLMEAVQLTEESIEYRDPDGDFIVIYSFPRGYIAKSRNYSAEDISGESFDHLEDAIEHAEICMSIADDNYNEGQPTDYEEMQDFMGGDDWDHGQYDESVIHVTEDDDGYHRGNIGKLTRRLCDEHDQNVSNILTDKLRGQVVALNVLGKHDGARGMGWKIIPVKIDHVEYSEHDVNGPTYVSVDGREYQSHPDHDVVQWDVNIHDGGPKG